ncbi:hypothetical protein BJ508DRAFT_412276 [Ascobolus immersus RN42]|uniref:Uncharacterized protein n=1 Tax=Ascobolus immersus RN42 TaxID=1160509 RepID=A0A3N4ILT2_ASCIM|nr:hypothetical protein BJ508DRAFT_412276 [Ascobolus immersus RN42]
MVRRKSSTFRSPLPFGNLLTFQIIAFSLLSTAAGVGVSARKLNTQRQKRTTRSLQEEEEARFRRNEQYYERRWQGARYGRNSGVAPLRFGKGLSGI